MQSYNIDVIEKIAGVCFGSRWVGARELPLIWFSLIAPSPILFFGNRMMNIKYKRTGYRGLSTIYDFPRLLPSPLRHLSGPEDSRLSLLMITPIVVTFVRYIDSVGRSW